MERVIKKNQTNVTLKHYEGELCIEREFKIEKFLGQGASCNVYLVSYIEDDKYLHKGILKEFSPVSKRIKLEKFLRGYSLQSEFRAGINGATNIVSNTEGIYSDDDKTYILMSCDEGSSYEEILGDTLIDTLKTILAITKAVKVYHDAGYLHLDIKPDNIYVLPETREFIKLFDFDSVVKIEDILDGAMISYSEKWASVEVTNGVVEDICEAADIYSIGIMLFYKLLGRIPSSKDQKRTSKFEYLEDETIFKNASPKIIGCMKKILKQTICERISTRYEICDELIEDLEEVIELLSARIPVLADVRMEPVTSAVGRESEIKVLHKKLKEENFVFIRAMGGIGKSELVKMYIKQYGNDFDRVQFITFNDSIKKTIAHKLSIINFNDDDYLIDKGKESEEDILFKSKVKCLDDFDGKNLIVIDNFNKDFDEDLMTLLNSKENSCKFVFTTRNYNREFASSYMNLDTMSEEKCLELYFNILGEKKKHRENSVDTIKEIIRIVERNTLAIKLISANCRDERVKPERVLEKLKECETSDIEGRVSHERDEEYSNKLIYEHFCAIFDVTNMSEEEKYVMKNLALLGRTKIDAATFRELCKLNNFSDINNLSILAWIEHDEKYDMISLHHIISDIILEELKPNVEECKALLELLLQRLESNEYKSYRQRNRNKDICEIVIRKIKGKSKVLAELLLVLVKKDINSSEFSILGECLKKINLATEIYVNEDSKRVLCAYYVVNYYFSTFNSFEIYEIEDEKIDTLEQGFIDCINEYFKVSIYFYNDEKVSLAEAYIKLAKFLNDFSFLIMIDEFIDLHKFIVESIEDSYKKALEIVSSKYGKEDEHTKKIARLIHDYYSEFLSTGYDGVKAKRCEIEYNIGWNEEEDKEEPSRDDLKDLAFESGFSGDIKGQIKYLQEALKAEVDVYTDSDIYLELLEVYLENEMEVEFLALVSKIETNQLMESLYDEAKLYYFKGKFYSKKHENDLELKCFNEGLKLWSSKDIIDEYDEYYIFSRKKEFLLEIAYIYRVMKDATSKEIYLELLEKIKKFEEADNNEIIELYQLLGIVYVDENKLELAYEVLQKVIYREEQYMNNSEVLAGKVELCLNLFEKLVDQGLIKRAIEVLVELCITTEGEREYEDIFKKYIKLELKRAIEIYTEDSYEVAELYKLLFECSSDDDIASELRISDEDRKCYEHHCRFDLIAEEKIKRKNISISDQFEIFKSTGETFKNLEKDNDAIKSFDKASELFIEHRLNLESYKYHGYIYINQDKAECLKRISKNREAKELLKSIIAFMDKFNGYEIIECGEETKLDFTMYDYINLYKQLIDYYKDSKEYENAINEVENIIKRCSEKEECIDSIIDFYEEAKELSKLLGDCLKEKLYSEKLKEILDSELEFKD